MIIHDKRTMVSASFLTSALYTSISVFAYIFLENLV